MHVRNICMSEVYSCQKYMHNRNTYTCQKNMHITNICGLFKYIYMSKIY